jgi:hypothetical protein
MTAVLFIDANQYLRLYGLVAGKGLLDSLEEQKEHILVSAQIVDEVLRNKLRIADEFFAASLKEIQAAHSAVPDHLLGITDEKVNELRQIIGEVRRTRTEISQLAADALALISTSQDDVSKRLEAIFQNAIKATPEEMQRARDRKEVGNPPGKPSQPLGDQITWEQLLSHCKHHKVSKLWIISRDGDFAVKSSKQVLLNPLLRRDLVTVCGDPVEIYCFDDLIDGLQHFASNAGVTAQKLPTEEEAARIKRELERLPPIGWMTQGDDGTLAAIRSARARANFVTAFSGASGVLLPLEQGGGGFIGSSGVPPPPPTPPETGKKSDN